MNVTFYQFSKSKNSTKQVNVTGTDFPCNLKERTSILSPTFIIQSPVEMYVYNYCKAFNRYYFVENVESVANNIWAVTCSVDVLATYRNSILNSTQFVQYSNANYDISVQDSRFPTTTTPLITSTSARMDLLYPSGTNILTCIGTTPIFGFTCTYSMTASALQDLALQVTTNVDLWNMLKNWLFSPYESIVTCIKLPVNPNYIDGPYENIFLGNFNTGVNGTLITRTTYSDSITFTIPWQFPVNDFRNTSPYSIGKLYLAGYGDIDINLDDFKGATTLTLELVIDVLTGIGHYYVKRGDEIMQTISVGYGVPRPLAQLTSLDFSSVAGGIGAVIGGAVTGNLALSAGGFLAVTNGSKRIGSSSGTNGANLLTSNLCTLTVITHDTVTDPSSVSSKIGRPCCKNIKLSDCGSFAQTTNANVNIKALGGELQEINALLDSGIYLE